MRFIHAADLHLDSPISGLRPGVGADRRNLGSATRQAYRRMVDFAIAEKVDFVLIAGDIFDRDWPDYATGLFFASGLSDLEKAGIRVAMIRGNHDAGNRMSKKLDWPKNVHEFDSRAPSTFFLEDLGAAVHGQSFGDRAVPENLAAAYPPPAAGWFNIGLLHTSGDGTYGHDTYAPCAISDLVGKGYDYWALGHVHQRRVLATDPYIVFPGNLQGRHVKEPGEKGFTLVTVEAGRVRDVVACPADGLRWADLHVDVSRATTLDEALPLVGEALAQASAEAGDQALAARLRLVGTSPAHGAIIAERSRFEAECDSLAEQCAGTLYLEKILVETRPPDRPRGMDAGRADLSALFRAICDDPSEAAELRLGLEDALHHVPPNLATRPDVGLTPIGDERFARLLADAQALLAHRLGVGDRRR